MLTVLILATTVLTVAWVASNVLRWKRNYQLGKSTGFATFVSPIHTTDTWWMMSYPLLLPILEKLPFSWTRTWLSMSKTWQVWKTGHQPFTEADEDTFILSTPRGNVLWTCDHSVIHDLYVQHPKVQLPVDVMSFWDVWGPSIGSSEGDVWKAHRKVVSAGLGSSINGTVWRESQRQTKTLVDYWVQKQNATVDVMFHWTSRLAIHVITCGFFDMRLEWDGEGPPKDVNHGTELPLDKSLPLLVRHLSTVFMTPRAFLHRLPFARFREASVALKQTEAHIGKQRAAAEANVESLMKKRNPNLLESIIISGNDPEMTNRSPFLETSVLSNLFFALLAGHETAGSSLGLIFILSALYPEMQERIQTQLDRHFESRADEEWSVEQDYPALIKGYIGAVQRETLSIYHPASFNLRRVVEPVEVTDSNRVTHTVPAGTLSMINFAAAFRNPKYWQQADIPQSRRLALSNSPALDFNPDRWLDSDGKVKESFHMETEKGTVPDWWAFGQGPRMCPGKAFAQIELTCVIATLFKDYSLELVVDKRILAACDGDEKAAWEKTRDEGIRMLYDDIDANITISLSSKLPIRVVKRA